MQIPDDGVGIGVKPWPPPHPARRLYAETGRSLYRACVIGSLGRPVNMVNVPYLALGLTECVSPQVAGPPTV